MTKEFNKRDVHMIKTGFNEGIRKTLKNISKILKRFKDNSIYTGRIVKFEIENRLELNKINTHYIYDCNKEKELSGVKKRIKWWKDNWFNVIKFIFFSSFFIWGFFG